jgi:hypothetical protein
MNIMSAQNPNWEERSFTQDVEFHGLQLEVIGTWFPRSISRFPWEVEAVTVIGSKGADGYPVDLSEMVLGNEVLSIELNQALEGVRS